MRVAIDLTFIDFGITSITSGTMSIFRTFGANAILATYWGYGLAITIGETTDHTMPTLTK
jgi:hypothetical protein